MYTAAFGGRPSGALLSGIGLHLQGLAWAAPLNIHRGYVNLTVAPLFHIAAWTPLIATLLMAGNNVIARRADPLELCRLIESEECEGGHLHLPTVASMAECNSDHKFDLSSFHSPIRISGWDEMTQPGPALHGWGQTETTGAVLIGAYGSGSPDRPINGRPSSFASVRVANEIETVQPGESGEILVRGPSVAHGYWNRRELSEQKCLGGWWHSGDLGRLETDGSITFLGPLQRMLKTGGENVYPIEVERCICTHDQVEAAAVIGVPHELWNQSVVAIVVAKDLLSEFQVIEHVRSNIATYKSPRQVIFVESLPITNGNIDYDELDAKFGGGNYPGSQSNKDNSKKMVS
jgi:acyl-CoA synthetase (AMP-forming)/AMP-acid ligase II